MVEKLFHFLSCVTIYFLCLMPSLSQAEPRQLQHMHLQSSPIYGNSTDLEYFYLTVYIGTHKQPQALILDTGSALAAIPCKNYCSSGTCGSHIHDLYDPSQSTSHHVFNCRSREANQCTCVDHDRCRFYQGYAEGSAYEGYIVRDTLSLDPQMLVEDTIEYKFGCIRRETNYFYSQKADGILGMSNQISGNRNNFEPIYKTMKNSGVIDKEMFAICLGKNGGYLQLGGYDGHGSHTEIKWTKMIGQGDYRINLNGMQIGQHFLPGSDTYDVGFIDTGTTFTFLPYKVLEAVRNYFMQYCNQLPNINCQGKMLPKDKSTRQMICFDYSESEHRNLKQYFASYPVVRLMMQDLNGQPFTFDWYPSEYLYRESLTKYCIAAEPQSSQEILLGGTLLRQHNVVFDIDNWQVGFQHATCAYDPNQVIQEQEHVVSRTEEPLDSQSNLYNVEKNDKQLTNELKNTVSPLTPTFTEKSFNYQPAFQSGRKEGYTSQQIFFIFLLILIACLICYVALYKCVSSNAMVESDQRLRANMANLQGQRGFDGSNFYVEREITSIPSSSRGKYQDQPQNDNYSTERSSNQGFDIQIATLEDDQESQSDDN